MKKEDITIVRLMKRNIKDLTECTIEYMIFADKDLIDEEINNCYMEIDLVDMIIEKFDIKIPSRYIRNNSVNFIQCIDFINPMRCTVYDIYPNKAELEFQYEVGCQSMKNMAINEGTEYTYFKGINYFEIISNDYYVYLSKHRLDIIGR